MNLALRRGLMIVTLCDYLVAIALIELVSTLAVPAAGLGLYAALLVALLIHSALAWERPEHSLLLSLTLAPLIRIVSFTLPLDVLPQLAWYVVTSVPLFVAAFLAARALGFSRVDVGLTAGRIPLQLLVMCSGLVLGYTEYQILHPPALVPSFAWPQMAVAALILLVCTGVIEEVIFRGLQQRAAQIVFRRFGIVYVSLLFAILHMGYNSAADLVFVFVVAMFFGWVVARTRTLLGVSLAHGLTNIMLFLVMPFAVANGWQMPAPPDLPAWLGGRPTAGPAVTATFAPTGAALVIPETPGLLTNTPSAPATEGLPPSGWLTQTPAPGVTSARPTATSQPWAEQPTTPPSTRSMQTIPTPAPPDATGTPTPEPTTSL